MTARFAADAHPAAGNADSGYGNLAQRTARAAAAARRRLATPPPLQAHQEHDPRGKYLL